MSLFNLIRFVLVGTTHPGNIGASARAMKNMGFKDLALVAPKYFPDPEATARSSGAEDILENSRLTIDLTASISDCHVVLGTSSRSRSLPIPLVTAKEAADLAADNLQQHRRVAFVFGQERTGLTNEELALCHYHLYIPCDSDFPSLNVASALQIIAYELRQSLLALTPQHLMTTNEIVSGLEMERFYEHLETILIKLQFLDPTNPRQLMRKLRRLFNRLEMEQNEMNILRGILAAIEKSTN